MNAKLILAAVIGTLILAHPHVSSAGLSLVPVYLAGAVALACGVATLLVVRLLHRAVSCPHPHPIT